jgi:peptide/nickel transport system ATP-binding protein
MNEVGPLLRLEGVTKSFRSRKTGMETNAVAGVSLDVMQGECLGLVGESGSGKTTLGGIIAGIVVPDGGTVTLRDHPLYINGKYQRANWKRIQYVFQDPYTSLNPRMKVGQIVAEPLRQWKICDREESEARMAQLLSDVGLDPAVASAYPTRLSGGQRQRVAIARALAVEPDLVILDEAVSALDVTVQAQIIRLLQRLKAQSRRSLIFITHDISVVRLIAERVAVMQGGRIVEFCDVKSLQPELVKHEYTRTLLEAVPTLVGWERLDARDRR